MFVLQHFQNVGFGKRMRSFFFLLEGNSNNCPSQICPCFCKYAFPCRGLQRNELNYFQSCSSSISFSVLP